MPGGNSPISQEIILALQQTGSLDQVISQLMKAKDELEALNRTAQANAKSDKELETATYDVGGSYEVLAEKIGRASTAAEKNVQAAPWASKQQAAIADLVREMGVYEQRSDALTATELRNYQAIASAATRTGAAVQNANQRTVSSSQGASRAILEISRGIEDLATGGFLGILNNVPGTVQAIGTAAGLSKGAIAALTGGISLLATAAFELYTNWDKLEAYFNIGVPRPILDTTEELKNKIAEASKVTGELGKKTNLSLTELREYREATARVKEFNAELERRRDLESILSGKSKAERERSSAFKEAVAETGGVEAVRALEGAIDPHAVGGKVFNEFTGKNSTPRELSERLIGAAGEGDKRARDQVVELLNLAYKPAKGSFASNIVETSPEAVAKKKAAEEAALEQQRINDRLKATDPNLTGKSRDAGLNAEIVLAEEHVRDKTRDFEQGQREKKAAQAAKEAEGVEQIRINDRLKREQGAAGHKADTAHRKAVNAADDPYLQPLQQAITANRLGQVQGDPGAMKEARLAKVLERQVGQNLRGAGQDPGLAHGIVENAFKQANDSYTRMFAQTGNREQALIGVTESLMANIAQQQAAGERRDAQIGQLQARANMLGMQAERAQQTRQPPLSRR